MSPPAGVEADARLLEAPRPPKTHSSEERVLELELHATDDAKPGRREASAYALYYVCEGIDGTCVYRRQDVSIPLRVTVDPQAARP